MKNLMFVGAVALSMACLANNASATVLASDDFSYSDGPLAGNTGGVGWATNAWLPPVNVNLFADVTSGEGVTGWTTANNNNPSAPRQLGSALTSTFYVGYMLHYENTGSGGFGGNNTFTLHLSNTAANTSSLNFGIRSSGTGSNPSASNNLIVRYATGDGAVSSGLVTPSADYFLVAKVSYNSTGTNSFFDRIDMWVNPTTEGTPDNSLVTTAAAAPASINYLFYRVAANEADDRYFFDNLVVGETFNDVIALVPEPTAFALAGLGMAALFIFRRRS